MRVFIFGTGRCGTVSTAEAFKHTTNYTVGHESLCSLNYYPDNHIEVNPQLRVVMADVFKQHPDALYIWLTRDPQKVVESYERLDRGNWLNHWWVMCNSVKPVDRMKQAEIAVDYMALQCRVSYDMVKVDNRLKVDIADFAEWFPKVWEMIGAEGAYTKALDVFRHPQNTSKQRGDS